MKKQKVQTMKIKCAILGAIILAFTAVQSFAVVDQQIQVQGTNLVLSWPSQGYECYMVEYRPSLDPSAPWIQLTNCYRANSTNRTTYTIPCCTLIDLGGGSSMSSFSSGGESLITSESADSGSLSDTELWAAPADGSGDAAPLALYPPGFNTNTLVIYEAVRSAIQRHRAAYSSSFSSIASDGPGGVGMGGLTSGGCDCPDMGFFRVWHIPEFPASITNYTFDGPIFVPVDFKDYLNRVEDIVVLLNGEPVSDSEFTSLFYGGQTNWGMGIYFDFFPSGTYQIQLQTTLRLNDNVGDDEVRLVLSSPIKSITVDNQVTYTNWDSDGLIFGGDYTFKAQTKNLDTDWYIDIYDYYGDYVNGGSGHTYNGQIAWTWDLTDTFGNRRDDLDSDPFFYPYITFDESSAAGPSGGSAPTPQAQTTRRTPAPMAQFPAVGGWIVAYLDRYYLDAGPKYSDSDSYYQDGLNDIEGGPALWSIPISPIPLHYGTNVYSQADRNNSWATLKAYLFTPSYRNLYYFGHGGADIIGADMHTFDTSNNVTGGISFPGSKALLTSQIVSNELTFNRYSGPRPYRFVFLDGCNTANGKWPSAFGVDKTTHDLSWYTGSSNKRRVRPSAFVGWTVTVGGKGWGTVDKFWECRGFWMGDWSVDFIDYTLNDALEEGDTTSNWIPISQFRDKIRVYGYQDMHFREYNSKGDWSP